MRYFLIVAMLAISNPAHSEMTFDDRQSWHQTGSALRMSNSILDNRTVVLFSSFSCKYCQFVDESLTKVDSLLEVELKRVHVNMYPIKAPTSSRILPIEIAAMLSVLKLSEKIEPKEYTKLNDFLYRTYVPIRDQYLKSMEDVKKKGRPIELVRKVNGSLYRTMDAAKNKLDSRLIRLGFDQEIITKTRMSFAVSTKIKSYVSTYRNSREALRKSNPSDKQLQRFGNSVPSLVVGDSFWLIGKFLSKNSPSKVLTEINRGFR